MERISVEQPFDEIHHALNIYGLHTSVVDCSKYQVASLYPNDVLFFAQYHHQSTPKSSEKRSVPAFLMHRRGAHKIFHHRLLQLISLLRKRKSLILAKNLLQMRLFHLSLLLHREMQWRL